MYDQKYWKMYYLLHYRYNGFHLLVLFYIIFFFLQTLSYFIFPCIHTCFHRLYFLKMTIFIAVKSSLKSEVQENGDSEKSGDKQEKSEEENSDSSKRTSDSDKSESLGEGAIENVDEIMV